MASVTWAYGDDAFRVREFAKGLPSKLNVETVDHLPDGASNGSIMDAVLGVSLLGTTKLVVVRDPAFLSAVTSPDSLTMVTQLASIPQGHYLLILSTKTVDGRTKLAQALKKVTEVHEFTSFKEWEGAKVREWLVGQLNGLQRHMPPAAMELLLDTVGKDIGVLQRTLDTLVTYAGDSPITVDTVTAVVGARSGSFYRLTEALRVKDRKVIFQELLQLEADEDAVRILGTVSATMHQFIMTLELMRQGKTFQEIGGVLERHPFVIQKSVPDIKRHYTIETLAAIIHRLQSLDLGLKSGEISPSGAMALLAGAFA